MHVLGKADLAQLRSLQGGEEPVWLDLRDPDDEELDSVGEILGLHPLAIEDSREFGQRPKLDRYDDRFLLVFFGVQLDADENPEQVEVHIHVAPGAVLTVSRVPPAELERVRHTLEHTPECSRGQLVYRILDTLTDSVSDSLQTIASRIDVVAQTILTRPRASDRDRMSVLGRSLGPLHRTLAIQRRVLDRAVDQIAATAGPSEDLHPYLADIADHLSQALDDVDADHDTLRAMLDTYSNAVQERLTIVATIFLPLSVLTGFFGMNFTWLLDHLGGVWTFFGLGVGGLLASCLLILAWLRRTGMT
jgi:magnesium transporter